MAVLHATAQATSPATSRVMTPTTVQATTPTKPFSPHSLVDGQWVFLQSRPSSGWQDPQRRVKKFQKRGDLLLKSLTNHHGWNWLLKKSTEVAL